jgi:hypothetical protein
MRLHTYRDESRSRHFDLRRRVPLKIELALFGIAAVGGLALMTGAASAMPNGLLSSISQLSNIDEVSYVCIAWRQGGKRPNHYGGGRRFYARPQGYNDWLQSYPADERDMSPATQAAEEGGR